MSVFSINLFKVVISHIYPCFSVITHESNKNLISHKFCCLQSVISFTESWNDLIDIFFHCFISLFCFWILHPSMHQLFTIHKYLVYGSSLYDLLHISQFKLLSHHAYTCVDLNVNLMSFHTNCSLIGRPTFWESLMNLG